MFVYHARAISREHRAAAPMNILFDLDGTLTDSSPGFIASIRHALLKLDHPVPPDAEIQGYIGPPLEATLASLLGSDSAEHLAAGIAHYRERYGRQGLFENSVYPGIPEALALLRDAGATLFVATSKPHVFACRILEHFGLQPYFKAIYGSELDGRLSNKAELIAHLLAAESLAPAVTFMVGDRLHDVRGALANGVTPIGILWGFGSQAELVEAGAQLFCHHPSQLQAMLQAGSQTLAQSARV